MKEKIKTNTLTIDSIKNAIEMLENVSKQPYLTCIKSREKGIDLLRKSTEARNFYVFGGIPVFQTNSVPESIMRFEMSDGTYKDVEMTNNIKYLHSM